MIILAIQFLFLSENFFVRKEDLPVIIILVVLICQSMSGVSSVGCKLKVTSFVAEFLFQSNESLLAVLF